MFEEYQLTDEERSQLEALTKNILDGELAQARDLIKNCSNKYQFAKTHSVYIEDWETTKAKMERNLPSGVSVNFHKALISEVDKMINAKLETVREAFQIKFGESIYNYLGKDGKTKFLGIF